MAILVEETVIPSSELIIRVCEFVGFVLLDDDGDDDDD